MRFNRLEPTRASAQRSGHQRLSVPRLGGTLVLISALCLVLKSPLRKTARILRQELRTERAAWAKRAERSISCEILSVSRFSKQEFEAFRRQGAPAPVCVGLDDPFPGEYQMVKVRLRNEGAAISRPLQFH